MMYFYCGIPIMESSFEMCHSVCTTLKQARFCDRGLKMAGNLLNFR